MGTVLVATPGDVGEVPSVPSAGRWQSGPLFISTSALWGWLWGRERARRGLNTGIEWVASSLRCPLSPHPRCALCTPTSALQGCPWGRES